MNQDTLARAAAFAYAFLYLGSAALGQGELSSNHLRDLVVRDPKTDVNDFSWIKTWSAVGDSFTAGIGSGNLLTDHPEDLACSRYDYSYASIMNRYFGSSVSSFTYSACSGATSVDIDKQINALPNGQDLVVLTAGGNDLCLTDIIQKCILNSITSESDCNDAINSVLQKVSGNGQFSNNVNELLTSLDAKMNVGGIVVYSLYAQYFNDQTDACTDKEDWVFPYVAGSHSLLLTKDRRTKLNSLVSSVNSQLKSIIVSAGGSSRKRAATYVYSDWDLWLPAIKGHFCEELGTPYPDDGQNHLTHFFKLSTPKAYVPGERRGRRDVSLYNTSLPSFGKSFQAEPILNSSLVERDPTPSTCGKGLFSLPDSIGKIFHPSELGHETMFSFALDAIRVARAKLLNLPDPECQQAVDSLTCYQLRGSSQYATPYALYSNTADFCSSAAAYAPKTTPNWQFSKSYNVRTLDENTFSIQLSNGAFLFSESACNLAVNNILDNCDGNDPTNPMGWKFGGEKVESSHKYSIVINRDHRPWHPPKRALQSCHGQYYPTLSHYDIYGQGWASWDNGEGLRANISACIGRGISGWGFSYFDLPYSSPHDTNDNPYPQGGWEWHAWFNTPIWTNARCFNNYKVQGGAGGPTDSVYPEKACSGTG